MAHIEPSIAPARRGPPRWIWFVALALALPGALLRWSPFDADFGPAGWAVADVGSIGDTIDAIMHAKRGRAGAEILDDAARSDDAADAFAGVTARALAEGTKAGLIADLARAENAGLAACTPALATMAPARRAGVAAVSCVETPQEDGGARAISLEFSPDAVAVSRVMITPGHGGPAVILKAGDAPSPAAPQAPQSEASQSATPQSATPQSATPQSATPW